MTRSILGLLVCLPLLAVAACSDSADTSAAATPPAAPPAIAVGVMTMQPQSAPKLVELPGRVVPLATAEVRPQVNGVVQSLEFREGRSVKAGDVLYRLDDKPFQAARDASAAAVKKADATVAGAQATFDRATRLVASQTSSAQTLDDARSTLLQAQADREAAAADLQMAEINLGYTVIKAPLSGEIGTSSVSIGSLVTANQTDAMATIRQIDPIYVDLVDSSANLLKVREQIAEGRLGLAGTDGKREPPKVTLTLETGTPYDQTGAISAADGVVSETTGTFSIRATFANPKKLLVPGMYVRASVDLGTIPDIFLVPQRAVSRDAAGKATAYVVGADGKAESRVLETDGSTSSAWIVTAGLKAGDRLVVDGLQKLTAGAAIAPVEVEIGTDSVIKQTLPAPKPRPPGPSSRCGARRRKGPVMAVSYRQNALASFFIDRPIFAIVLAIATMLGGVMGIVQLPISQYPEIAPVTVRISASYPGATAEAVENSVTRKIEAGMTGLDDSIYMESSSSTGSASITLTFANGADPALAQVDVQNKLAARAAAARRGADQRRHRLALLDRHPDDRQPRLQRRPLFLLGTRRHHVEPHRGADRARRGRRLHPGLRLRLCHAHLARSGQAPEVPADAQRRHRRDPRPERPGLGRLDRLPRRSSTASS